MSNTLPSVEVLRKILKLVERKYELNAEILHLENEISMLNPWKSEQKDARALARKKRTPKTSKPKTTRSKSVPVTRGATRRNLKHQILEVLKEAGDEGMKVGDVAARLQSKKVNINAWFSGTGKKEPRVKKIAPARYVYQPPSNNGSEVEGEKSRG